MCRQPLLIAVPPVSSRYIFKKRIVFPGEGCIIISRGGFAIAQRKTMDLTNGPVTGKLLRFVYPVVITNLLQYCYNAADKAVVGHFSGSDALPPLEEVAFSILRGYAKKDRLPNQVDKRSLPYVTL